MEPQWLKWARLLQAVAQNGLTFTSNPFDVERYEQIRQIAAEMLACRASVDVPAVLDLFVREKDYATPKVDTRAAVFKNGQILLVKERSDAKWSLPGGWADVCESPSESVEREVWEESGFEVEASRLAAVYDRSKHPHEPLMHYHIYKLFFICDIVGGEAKTSNETEEVAFFPQDRLPDLSLTKILPEQIARMFAYFKQPDLPVYFD